jgi:beta-galactosidase
VRKRGEGETYQQKLTVCKNAYRFVWENVKYAPGTLKVVVKKNGKPWATAQRVTTGAAAEVKYEVDRPTIAGDGCDLAYISLSLVDKKGNVVPTDSRKVRFSISGPARLVGFCNGDPTDHTCMQDKKQRFFNGLIIAIVRGIRGKAGTAEVTVKADRLPEVTIPVKVASGSPEN